MTFFRDMATAPLARLADTIMGSISGVRPTATDSANNAACTQSPFVKPLRKSTTGTMPTMNRMSTHDTAFTPFSKFVRTRVSATRRAKAPNSVSLPHGDDEGQSRTADHRTAHEREIVAFQRIAARLRLCGGPLFHRFALTGQRRLADEKIFGFDDTHIGGDHVARGEPDHVAHNKLRNRAFPALAVTHDRNGGFDHRLQAFRRIARAHFLPQTAGRR